jgi:hypothetical protein
MHLNKTFPPRTESVQMIRVGECRMRNLWRAIAQFFVEGLLDDTDARPIVTEATMRWPRS